MRDPVQDGENFLCWLTSGADTEGVSREAMIALYDRLAAVTKLRRPRAKLTDMPERLLMEEVAMAALAAKYDRSAKFILDCLTPGRDNFETLAVDSPHAHAMYERFRHGEITWEQTIELTYSALMDSLKASAAKLELPEPELPAMSRLAGARERVAYLHVLYGLLKEYQSQEVNRRVFSSVDIANLIPDLT